MNTLLTATAVFGFGYISFAFLSGLVCLWQSTAVVVPTAIAPVVVVPEPEPEIVIVSVEVLSELGVRELRARCTARQIAWKNANGKNKHLRKEQMLLVLATV